MTQNFLIVYRKTRPIVYHQTIHHDVYDEAMEIKQIIAVDQIFTNRQMAEFQTIATKSGYGYSVYQTGNPQTHSQVIDTLNALR